MAPAATPSVELDPTEVPPAARVHRSRLAIALAVTVAALPILVLDNFPATAATTERVDVAAEVTTVDAPSTSSAPTTALAPTAAAPTTSEAPSTTTTAAPTTTTRVPVRTVAVAKATTTTAPPTTQAPSPAPSGINGDPNDPATWDRMARCEADGNWAANTNGRYYGGLQFSLDTWRSVGGTGYPHQASREEQIHRGQILHSRRGWDAWPGCSRELGYT